MLREGIECEGQAKDNDEIRVCGAICEHLFQDVGREGACSHVGDMLANVFRRRCMGKHEHARVVV